MTSPFFSIIIPTHLRPRLLKRALTSLRNNTCRDFEIIVISDVGDLATYELVAEMLSVNDTFIKRTGSAGPALSRNLGIDLARGQRIIFLDDDDAFLPDFLERAYELSSKNQSCAIYTNFQVRQEDRKDPDAPPVLSEHSVSGFKTESVYVKNFIHNHTVLYPAGAIKHRRQDQRLSSLDDWDFLLNVMADVEFVHADISGPIIYKDYVNTGNRRGTSCEATSSKVILDYLSIYSKWPAPTEELKLGRKSLLSGVGLDIPVEWL